jgi:phage terminase small subunit
VGQVATKTRPQQVLHKTRFASGIDLTPKQRAFVVTLVRTGCKPTIAAKTAGYSDGKVAAHDLLKLPHVVAAVRLERERYISSELANVATGTLRSILEDDSAAPAARVQAARTVLEMSGDIGRNKSTGDDERPLSEMSADELSRMIDRWQEEKAALATPVDAEDVEIVDSAQNRAQL